MKRFQITYGYDDVTLVPSYSQLKSRTEANVSMAGFRMPIIASCMDTLGKDMMNECIKNNIPFICHRAFKSAADQINYFIDEEQKNYNGIWFAVGSIQKYKDWIDYLFENGVRQFCIDMAHGDSKACIDTIHYIKQQLNKYKSKQSKLKQAVNNHNIIAGNVATAEGFKRLQNAGAQGIRIGVGSGQICSTSIQTAMGVPIITNIMQCNNVRNKNVWIIADGGIKCSGDIAKAVYFGADFCMIGKLFASTDKACGNCYNKDFKLIQIKDNDLNRPIYPEQFDQMYKIAEELDWNNRDPECYYKKTVINNLVAYKEYHGMASRQARKNILSYASVEGVEGLIKYSQTTQKFIIDTELRLKASLSYAGATNWQDFKYKTYPVLRSNAGIIAAGTHLDVTWR